MAVQGHPDPMGRFLCVPALVLGHSGCGLSNAHLAAHSCTLSICFQTFVSIEFHSRSPLVHFWVFFSSFCNSYFLQFLRAWVVVVVVAHFVGVLCSSLTKNVLTYGPCVFTGLKI